MALLPNDYHHLVTCPEEVIISDKHCIMIHFDCLVSSPGFIRERATWCYPVYHLFDSVGSHTMKIRGPFCHFGCFADVVYHVTNCEGQELATVTKR